MLDPNWFYSSLAQSAAAIVGLLGGIFAGRLQEQITASREERLKSIDVLRDLHRRLAPFRGHLEIYLQHADAQIALLESELSQGRKTMHRPVWYAPTGIGNLNIEVSEQTIQVEKEQTREAKVLFPLVVAALDKNSATGVYDLHDAFFDASISALPKTIGEVSNLRAVMGNTHRQLKSWNCVAEQDLAGCFGFASSDSAYSVSFYLFGFFQLMLHGTKLYCSGHLLQF